MSTWQDALYEAHQKKQSAQTVQPTATTTKVIRQADRTLNKTEARFRLDKLLPWLATGEIDRVGEHESVRFAIGNGVTFAPDWPAWKDGRLRFYEVKGAFIREDAIVKLKCFATQYPEHELWLYQWKGGDWIVQRILP